MSWEWNGAVIKVRDRRIVASTPLGAYVVTYVENCLDVEEDEYLSKAEVQCLIDKGCKVIIKPTRY